MKMKTFGKAADRTGSCILLFPTRGTVIVKCKDGLLGPNSWVSILASSLPGCEDQGKSCSHSAPHLYQ